MCVHDIDFWTCTIVILSGKVTHYIAITDYTQEKVTRYSYILLCQVVAN